MRLTPRKGVNRSREMTQHWQGNITPHLLPPDIDHLHPRFDQPCKENLHDSMLRFHAKNTREEESYSRNNDDHRSSSLTRGKDMRQFGQPTGGKLHALPAEHLLPRMIMDPKQQVSPSPHSLHRLVPSNGPRDILKLSVCWGLRLFCTTACSLSY